MTFFLSKEQIMGDRGWPGWAFYTWLSAFLISCCQLPVFLRLRKIQQEDFLSFCYSEEKDTLGRKWTLFVKETAQQHSLRPSKTIWSIQDHSGVAPAEIRCWMALSALNGHLVSESSIGWSDPYIRHSPFTSNTHQDLQVAHNCHVSEYAVDNSWPRHSKLPKVFTATFHRFISQSHTVLGPMAAATVTVTMIQTVTMGSCQETVWWVWPFEPNVAALRPGRQGQPHDLISAPVARGMSLAGTNLSS